MSNHPQIAQLLHALEKVTTRVDELESEKYEPIAIVGMSCRFPGGSGDPEAFWNFLQRGGDGIREVPADRWDAGSLYDPDPDAPGKMYTRRGGFIENVDHFDPLFFGISPNEAIALDPQQRLLLEVSWEAIEHAGESPEKLFGSRTGVFVGMMNYDYFQMLQQAPEGLSLASHVGTGNIASAAAGRLSYTFGFHGPAIALDTACSSSLVTIHLACESLRNRACDRALTGGVNLMLSPDASVLACRIRALSPDGRCKTFDEAADGYARGEGCGVLMLKRLSDAMANQDRILAVLRGSAVNQDGRSSSLTAPSGPAQEALIEQAHRNAQIGPTEVSYVEAHGTGTALGDPIEAQALGHVYGRGRAKNDPLVIGSVKTNIGHLESAAGVAGVIKTVLALQNQEIPRHLHFRRLNPHIPRLEDIPAKLPVDPVAWPITPGKKRLAAVSSFGISGTNAHVILEEAPEGPAAGTAGGERPAHVLCFSGKTDTALLELARRHEANFAARPQQPLADVCATANAGRAHFAERVAIVAPCAAAMQAKLRQFQAGERAPGVVRGTATAARPIAFLFSGQGAQYAGMGRQLYATQPTFQQAFDRCAAIVNRERPVALADVLWSDDAATTALLHETQYTQPALFALEYALSQLWQSWGVRPAAVLGHSVGEYVAAVVAGVVSLEDGLRLLAKRAALMQALPPGGAMASVAASEEQVRETIAPYACALSIAALNGPASTVISGASGALEEVLAHCERQGVRVKRLNVSHAFHSALMEPMLEEFEQCAQTLSYTPPTLRVIANVTGQVAQGGDLTTARYWREQIRQAVRFADGMATLAGLGIGQFVEVGPQPVLLGMGAACLPELGAGGWLASLRRERAEWEQLLEALGGVYSTGADIDWTGFDRDYARRRAEIPTYPFQRQRYWIEGGSVAARAVDPAWKSWLHERIWEPRPVDGASQPGTGTHVVISEAPELADAFSRQWNDAYPASPLITARPEDLDTLGSIGSLTFLATHDSDPCAPDVELCSRALALLKAALRGPAAKLRPESVQFVTMGAERVSGQGPSRPSQSALWGLVRVASLEHPDLRIKLVDLDPHASVSDNAGCLLQEAVAADGESEVCLRNGSRSVARVVTRSSVGAVQSTSFDPRASYLITGGLGSIGLRLARWMVECGARHLVLIGRTPLPERTLWDEQDPASEVGKKVTQIMALEASGATIVALAADTADRPRMRQVLSSAAVNGSAHAIKGIFHAAGISTSTPTAELCDEDLRRTVTGKTHGAWVLHDLSRELDLQLDYFVLFSSIASVWGSGGQGAYAAGNQYLDALAQLRHAQGLRALSVNWGPWADGGMATQEDIRGLELMGVRPLDHDRAFAAFGHLLDQQSPQVVVANMDWEAFRAVYECRAPRRLLDRLGQSETEKAKPTAAESSVAPSVPLQHASRSDLEGFLLSHIAHVLGFRSADEIDPNRPLGEVGLDSMMAIRLRERLKQAGLTITLADLFKFRTVTAWVNERFGKGADAPPAAAPGNDAPARRAEREESPPIPKPARALEAASAVAAGTSDGTGWIVVPTPRPSAHIKLVAFPYAGGGVSAYSHWAAMLPEFIELAIFQMAGRNGRIAEAPQRDLHAVVRAAAPAVMKYVRGHRFAFFGHCLGTVSLFEMTHLLDDMEGILPEYWLISGGRAPSVYTPEQLACDVAQFSPVPGVPGHLVADEEFIKIIKMLNFEVSTVLYEDAEMLELILPTLKADFEVSNTYFYEERKALPIPVQAWGGRIDSFVNARQLMQWRRHTTAPFQLTMCEGDHYFIGSHAQSITTDIARCLAPWAVGSSPLGHRVEWGTSPTESSVRNLSGAPA